VDFLVKVQAVGGDNIDSKKQGEPQVLQPINANAIMDVDQDSDKLN
jgi:hypothetical protein